MNTVFGINIQKISFWFHRYQLHINPFRNKRITRYLILDASKGHMCWQELRPLSVPNDFKVSLFCTSGHLMLKWSAQSFLGKMPADNFLLTPPSTLFCGQTFKNCQFPNFMTLKFIGKTTFQTIQRDVVMPVVDHSWSMMQDHMLKKIKRDNLLRRLAGKSRCDSPGFSAIYCTYSLMDIETQPILA